MVASQCFNANKFDKVILPSTIESLAEQAFVNCTNLKEIVCKSTTVPNTNSSAFSGIPSDAVIQVPYEALNDYKTTAPWNTYADNMIPYYLLSLDRDLIQALNATQEVKVALTCEAEEGWEVQSKPDWITVNPSSGTGPDSVTVTIGALEKGSADRNGEVIFKLSSPYKDYHTSVAIDQYNYQSTGETVVKSGEESDIAANEPAGDGNYIRTYTHSIGNGVKLVFMGEGYNAYDIKSGKYLTNIRTAIDHFFDIEPYKTYKDYFDVYIILARSEDSGIYGEKDKKHQARFGGKYYQAYGYKPNELTCFDVVKNRLGLSDSDLCNTLITIVMNTNEYPGVTYMWSDGKAIACVPVSTASYPYDFRGYVQHECGGHGFGKQGDENYYRQGFLQYSSEYMSFLTEKSYGWYDNLSDNANRKDVPWAVFLEDPDYNQIVDMYEGGYSFYRGVYRSEQNTCMNDFRNYFSAISRMAIVKRILSIAGATFDYATFKSKDVKEATSPTKTKTSSAVWTLDPYKHNAPVLMDSNSKR